MNIAKQHRSQSNSAVGAAMFEFLIGGSVGNKIFIDKALYLFFVCF